MASYNYKRGSKMFNPYMFIISDKSFFSKFKSEISKLL